MNTDRIEKSVLLKEPRERVWRAVSMAEHFGSWFGADFDGPFAKGARLGATIQATSVDPDVARQQQPYVGQPYEFRVEDIRPMEKISFRWHPYAVEAGVDYTNEPMTIIEFALSDADGGGTMLRITESGFDQIRAERRKKAYEANEGGWTAQCQLIKKYLEKHPQL